MQSSLEGFHWTQSQDELADLQRSASRARLLTSGPAWWLGAKLPWAGSPLHVARGLAVAGDELARHGLPDTVEAAEDLAPGKLRSASGRIDVAAIQRAADAARRGAAVAVDIQQKLRALPSTGLSPVDRRVEAARADVRDMATKLQEVGRLGGVAPALLGAGGKRTYFVVFQNNAEVRGTGGLPGSWAVVSVDKGLIHLDRVGSDADIPELIPPISLPFGPEFADRYVAFASDRLFVNANMTAHFPSAAYIFHRMWKQTSGQSVDGVLALDPVAESYILSPETRIPVPGKSAVLSSDNFVRYVESEIYADFPDVPQRKAVLAKLAGASFEALVSGAGAGDRRLLDGLRRAANERRLLLWSTNPAEQQVLAKSAVGGVVPEKTGPFLYTVLNNAAGSKLDYYLETDIAYTAEACGPQKRRPTKVTVTITNHAPARGLPPYVTIRADHAPWAKPGAEHVYVSMYVTPGAELTGVQLNGREDGVWVERERGHPVYTADVDIPPGKRVVITVHLDEPRLPGEAQVMVQPAVLPTTTSVHFPACR